MGGETRSVRHGAGEWGGAVLMSVEQEERELVRPSRFTREPAETTGVR